MSDPVVDQIGAAVRETGVVAERMRVLLGGEAVPTKALWAPWVVLDRLKRMVEGDPTLLGCDHLGSPTPLLMSTWAPVVVCHACVMQIPDPTPEQNYACDCCGATAELHAAIVPIGFVTVIGGVCPECKAHG